MINASASMSIACSGPNSYTQYTYTNPSCASPPATSAVVSTGTCYYDGPAPLYGRQQCHTQAAPYLSPGYTRGVVVNVYAGTTCNRSLPLVAQDK